MPASKFILVFSVSFMLHYIMLRYDLLRGSIISTGNISNKSKFRIIDLSDTFSSFFLRRGRHGPPVCFSIFKKENAKYNSTQIFLTLVPSLSSIKFDEQFFIIRLFYAKKCFLKRLSFQLKIITIL